MGNAGVSIVKSARCDYSRAVDYILSFADYERLSRSAVVFDLRRVEELLERLGNPQQHKHYEKGETGPRSVHIAGTKGKGSTAAMIASILTQCGYRTGLYTSPHLHSLRERIRVDDVTIPEEKLVNLVEQLKPEVEVINQKGTLGQLTTFEILTALAFTHFRNEDVDFQVLEVGLGGRLDATNVVSPEVCAITSISLDHTEILGNTLCQIAKEKAGIIKSGSVVVSSPQDSEVSKVITKTCHEKGAELVRVGKDIIWRKLSSDLSGQSFTVNGLVNNYELWIPLLGEHQLENAAVAVATLESLSRTSTPACYSGVKDTAVESSSTNISQPTLPGNRGIISLHGIARGMAQVRWEGRLQVLSQQPLMVVDSAHNGYSMRKLREALWEYFDFERLLLIVGISHDKDVNTMIAELISSCCSEVIITCSKHPRAMDVSALAEEFQHRGVILRQAGTVDEAVELALSLAQQRDLICATGSLFIVAEVIEYMRGREGN